MGKTRFIEGSNFKIFIIATVLIFSVFLCTCYWIYCNYASSAAEYTISFESNGGGNIDAISKGEGEILEEPSIPSKVGYSFGGWYIDENFGTPFTFSSMPSGNVVVYVKWEPNEYTISFNSNGGSVVSAITQDYGTVVSEPSDPTRTGYTFDSWCIDQGLDTEYNFTTMPAGDITLYAKWEIVIYDISFNNIENATNGNVNTYNIESDTVTLSDALKTAYNFLGWYDLEVGGSRIENIATGSTGDMALYARWEPTPYSISYNLTEGENSPLNPSVYTIESNTIILEDAILEGADFVAWYDEENNIVDSIPEGSFGDIVLYGVFGHRYLITYHFVQNSFNPNDNIYSDLSPTIVLENGSKDGYTFVGWFDAESEGNQVESIPSGSTGDLDLYARWIAKNNTLVFDGNGNTSGSMANQILATDATATLTTNSYERSGHSFEGWAAYPLAEVLYADGEEYTMGPEAEYTLYAIWEPNTGTVSFNPSGGMSTMGDINIATGDNLPANGFVREGFEFVGWATSADGDVEYLDEELFFVETDEESYTLYALWEELYQKDGTFIYFGEYPQTIASSEAVNGMGMTPDQDGYYTSSYDNERYSRVVGTPYTSGTLFSDGITEVQEGVVYYFKVEPIKWRIVSETDGVAFLICENIIVNKGIDDDSNNYEESEIRAWLNGEFYNIAFSELQKLLLETTLVDNSEESTGEIPNEYACADTNDKIFLPSYFEVTNEDYGFVDDEDRLRVSSDYTRANGVVAIYETGPWWLRSPSTWNLIEEELGNSHISQGGGTGYAFSVNANQGGVVPALTISLQQGFADILLDKNIEIAGNVLGEGRSFVGDEITISATTNDGFTWLGWYEGETKVSTGDELTHTFILSGDTSLEARWQGYQGDITYHSNDGLELTYDFSIRSADTLPTKHFTSEDFMFAGWATTADGEVEYTDRQAFIVENEEQHYDLYAVWLEFVRDGDYIWFGMYPQTLAESEAVDQMGDIPDSKGYFTSSYDNEKYAAVEGFVLYDYVDFTFSDGSLITGGQTYYFKVEPIKWRILSEEGGKALLVCDNVIENRRFNEFYQGDIEGIYANNYAESELRVWLNNEFYNTAFTSFQMSFIQMTEVDNSKETTWQIFDDNPYASEDTTDNIFLLSYADVQNVDYGYTSNDDRVLIGTDYSRASGTNTAEYGGSEWWMRSPCSYNSKEVSCVSSEGEINSIRTVNVPYEGVVPAMTFVLELV